jgi:hypothetical protein
MFGMIGIGSAARTGLAALALATAIGAAAVEPVAAARGDSVVGGTEATCLAIPDVIAGVVRKQLTAAFPTGTTGGKTYLAARIQSRFYTAGVFNAYQRWVTWANGSSWIHTNATRFPAGQFAVNGTWYRRGTFTWAENWLGQSVYSRVEFLVQFPDGHRSTVYSKWAMC